MNIGMCVTHCPLVSYWHNSYKHLVQVKELFLLHIQGKTKYFSKIQINIMNDSQTKIRLLSIAILLSINYTIKNCLYDLFNNKCALAD